MASITTSTSQYQAWLEAGQQLRATMEAERDAAQAVVDRERVRVIEINEQLRELDMRLGNRRGVELISTESSSSATIATTPAPNVVHMDEQQLVKVPSHVRLAKQQREAEVIHLRPKKPLFVQREGSLLELIPGIVGRLGSCTSADIVREVRAVMDRSEKSIYNTIATLRRDGILDAEPISASNVHAGYRYRLQSAKKTAANGES